MESFDVHENCPRCLLPGLKTWAELTAEEQFLAARLPASAEFTPEQRMKHIFCTRCWYEASETGETRT